MLKIYGSKFNVMSIFNKIGTYGVYYGIEIEIEFINETYKNTFIDKFYHFSDKFILKYEPSILCGLEIVSAPMNIEILIEELKNIIDFCIKHNAITSNRTGLHIHVSKNSYSNKIFQFINNPQDREEFISFSGRLSEYARYTNRSTPVNKGRGYCVNIYPKDTTEFRLFASKIDYEWIAGCIYFCELIVKNINVLKRYSDLIDLSAANYPKYFTNRLSNATKTQADKRYPLVYPQPDNLEFW
jgi:hypothetical protein